MAESKEVSVTATAGSTARTEAPTLTAGRALDLLIHEKVMGLEMPHRHNWIRGMIPDDGYGETHGWYCTVCRPKGPVGSLSFRPGDEWSPVCPHPYSTDIAAAWEVFDMLGGLYTIKGYVREGVREWRVQINDADFRWASTAPLAICLAALKAVSALSQTEEGK